MAGALFITLLSGEQAIFGVLDRLVDVIRRWKGERNCGASDVIKDSPATSGHTREDFAVPFRIVTQVGSS
ncbi:hypothetical protein OU789_11645 [Halocynthiibacter sp. C4]|uniref:hypothetical protein n=1 Tax=Halocynthiibacter sp. C4 TaxID=2992758 RepID=UPI00237C49B0|nr:hypothetical protein [Halocynthiibacter sp. C4]MDE0590580.1 hypothetical protein [Halocynthiibacter sp. C4]